MNDFENQKFCQSCAMHLTEELLGTNYVGSKNETIACAVSKTVNHIRHGNGVNDEFLH